MTKYKLIVTEEKLYDYLIKNFQMNKYKEIELIKFVCYGTPTELNNILQCDLHGDELDFTLKYDSENFEDALQDIIQELIDKGLVKEE